MCTPDQQKQKTASELTMFAFDAQPPNVRHMIATAPYGIPLRGHVNPDVVRSRIIRLIRERDVAMIGPVPTEYKRRKRARRR